ncbi:uncharacterized protein PHALS_14896 [Plasmopara halstedii]|uniref:RxLR-like protein n=1 Tax=Plasmopara halstedii TaxID=4781 RepID=A0A0P1AXD4_PLAHL|nr:uncharacterized protein PHALS_14896 [Plasmopara halstedii]CEG46437.1 hypothetical protein PHALS_14896 [Plasmopara halstedii]|eukprot:XP_024582806.1 hypothetical protein PHALS_14896 [Plasmopara halstedii]
MKSLIFLIINLVVASCHMATSMYNVLMYTDSRFEECVGRILFNHTNRCYPLCTQNENVAAFALDDYPQGSRLVVFEDFECQGNFIAGSKELKADLSTVASARKVRSFILSTNLPVVPVQSIVHSCHEKSDIIYNYLTT